MATLGSMGMAIVYGLKVNLSIAMVAMVNHTAIKMDSTTTVHNTLNVASLSNFSPDDGCHEIGSAEKIEVPNLVNLIQTLIFLFFMHICT